ncbi:MAG: isochorismate synthase [Actinobacteria bacterium]|nr:MAG: isochorismate synthase [Actinomycetota bacterium]
MSPSAGASQQGGRIQKLGDAFDLLAAYSEGGFLFERAGSGVSASAPMVATAPLAFARRMLADVDRAIDGGGRTVAVGTIPFREVGGTSTLSVAARSVRRTAPGETVRIDVGDDVVAPSEGSFARMFGRTPGSIPREPFTGRQLDAIPPPDGYAAAVAEVVRRLDAGLRKVVLARTIEVDAGRELDGRRLAHRLRAVNPDAFTFVTPTTAGILVGASPELLVSRFGREVRSNPLAGSAARSGDPDEDRANADALLASAKDREEHAIVVEWIARALRPFCRELTWDPAPTLLETPNVWHLSTRFRGLLLEPSPDVLELVETLHPTPAVAGDSREAALEVIRELEPFDRGSYAGPVGWMDASGDGEWAIALRCAELRGDRATLYAGAGIVAGSQPDAEVDETERKFRAFLDALRWG